MARSLPIVAEGLGKDFLEGFFPRKKTALDDLTFSVRPGTIFGFLGPNGAGKSTTLHLLVGFLRPSRGKAFLNGLPASNPDSRRGLGFLPEVFSFDRFSTARTLLHRFDALAGNPETGREGRINSALATVDLTEAAGRRIGTYSKGMTQRVGLAQALLGDPELLILDEPMSGMDPAGRAAFQRLLEERRDRGRTTLFSSHILGDVEQLADEVLILDEGRKIAQGTLADLECGDGTTAVIFSDPSPERFDPWLNAQNLSRKSEAEIPDAWLVEVGQPALRNAVLAHLAGNGADILSVAAVRTSLEDIFLRLTGGGQGEKR